MLLKTLKTVLRMTPRFSNERDELVSRSHQFKLSTYLLHKCIKALDYFVDTKNHLETENGSVSQEDRDERPLK